MFDGSNHRCDRRPLDASDPPRMLPAHAPLRGFSVRAWNHPPFARRAAEKAGSTGRAAPHSISGVAQTPRVYPDVNPRPPSLRSPIEISPSAKADTDGDIRAVRPGTGGGQNQP